MNINDIPMSFSMALAQQPEAMKRFSNMSDEEKDNVLSRLHDIKSKREMWSFVTELARN